MFLQRPHMRFDGLYVSRNTYLRKGLTEWRYKNPVHLVTYFRYLRFLPDGGFITRTSPEVNSSAPLVCPTQTDLRGEVWYLEMASNNSIALLIWV